MEIDSRPNLQEHQNNQHTHDSEHYLVMHNKTLKCVCELCTCGKHHCPRPRVKGNFSTSYADSYKKIEYKPAPQSQGQYKYEQRHYNPEALKTSYQDTYIKPQTNNFMQNSSRLENIGNKIVYQVPFVGSSSYKDQFKPYTLKPVDNPQQFRYQEQKIEKSPGQNYRVPQVKFQGISSYKSQFIEPPPKPKAQSIPQSTYQKMQVPFYGQSTYKQNFPQYKLQPIKTNPDQLSNSQVHMPTVRFQGSTSYKDQFKGYEYKSPERQRVVSPCIVEKLHVPTVNYINDKQHIYYDPDSHKFV